jgi:hypothetical protein
MFELKLAYMGMGKKSMMPQAADEHPISYGHQGFDL